jgi:hypothetical protein
VTIDELATSAARRIVLVNPPVVVADRVQLDYYADAFPFGLYQIRQWLRNMGHHADIADMMAYGKHTKTWDQLVACGELTPLEAMPAGPPGTHLPVWRYGSTVEWLGDWFDSHEEPDEVWVSCSMLFNSDQAHEVISATRRRFPSALIRFGGGYPSLLPMDAARSGANDVHRGRLYAADRVQPELDGMPGILHFVPFRLTTGCPNRCAFCLNGRDQMVQHDVDSVLGFIRHTRETRGIRHFNNWDPNVLRFKPHLRSFLSSLSTLNLDVALRFDMGLEPPLLDREFIELLSTSHVEAFSVPFETANPTLAGLFGKPYTIISSIRALDRLSVMKDRLFECHGTYVFGVPDEDLVDLFCTYHVIRAFGLRSTPFPLAVLPESPLFDRYGHLLEGRPYAHYNGHLFPLIQERSRAALYRRLLDLLTTENPLVADAKAATLPEESAEAYARGKSMALALIDAALESTEPDSVALLERFHKAIHR